MRKTISERYQIELVKFSIKKFKTADIPLSNTTVVQNGTIKYDKFKGKEVEFTTRLVRVQSDKCIEYRIYVIRYSKYLDNTHEAPNDWRLEKINMRDAKSRIITRYFDLNETEEQRQTRIDWITDRYKKSTDEERERVQVFEKRKQ